MDANLLPLLILQSLLALFLSALFWSMQRQYRKQLFFLWWSLAWTFQAVYVLLGVMTVQLPHGSLGRLVLQALSATAGFMQMPPLVLGVRAFLRPERERVAHRHLWFVAGWGAMGLTAFVVSRLLTGDPVLSFQIRSLPRLLAITGAYVYAASALAGALRRERASAMAISAVACVLMAFSESRHALAAVDLIQSRLLALPLWQPSLQNLGAMGGTVFDVASNLLLALGMVQLLVGRAQAIGQRLQASQELASAAFHASPDAISLARMEDGVYIQVSEGFCRVTGWTEAEALGKSSGDLALWTDARELRQVMDALRTKGECSGIELHLRRKDGSPYVGLASFRLLQIGGQSFRLAILRDISARKEMELSLRKASQAMEQSPMTIMITDVRGNLEFVNPAFTQITGYTAEEVMGRNPRLLKSGLTPPEAYRQMWDTITHGGTWEGEFCNRRKDGTVFWERGRISPVHDDAGRITHYVALKEDITEAREMEQTRRRLEQQSQVNQRIEAVGQLAGGVAHDINNMLSIMLTHIDLLTGQVGSDPAVNERLKAMEDAALRSAEIVRHLLTFARQQVTEPQILDLNAHLERLRRTFAPLLGEDQVLRLRLDPELLRVKVDPAQWDQVVMNLVINARDAMPTGGEITLATENLEVDEAFTAVHPQAKVGSYVCLSVADRGVGMTPEEMGKIFEPFYTTKPLGKGTGLGLSTVFGIVNQAGGFITVYSEPGTGSTFKVYVPAVRDAVPDAPAPEAAEAPAAPASILLVEDSDQLRDVIQDILELAGYHTRAAESPETALRYLSDPAVEVDLLLTDVIMPGMSGKELRDRAVVIRPGLKVLYMSGYTADIIARQGILDAGTDFLQKPFSRNAIHQKIRKALEAK